MRTALVATTIVYLSLFSFQSMSQPTTSSGTIMDLMQQEVTPVSDILWGANEEPTDQEWQIIEDAAANLITLSDTLSTGGSGPQDQQWVQQPAWKAFNLTMANAAEDARKAAQDHNIDALLDAGDTLYSSCEGCHLQFNPGVTGQ